MGNRSSQAPGGATDHESLVDPKGPSCPQPSFPVLIDHGEHSVRRRLDVTPYQVVCRVVRTNSLVTPTNRTQRPLTMVASSPVLLRNGRATTASSSCSISPALRRHVGRAKVAQKDDLKTRWPELRDSHPPRPGCL